MGFFDSDDSSRSSDLIEQQIRDNKAELESKRQNLTRARMDIVKSQGREQWTPDRNSPLDTTNKPLTPPSTLGGIRGQLPR